MAGNNLNGDKNDSNKRLREDENRVGKNGEPSETTQYFTDSLRLQDAISGAIKFREAGNEAFRAGNYELSILGKFWALKIVQPSYQSLPSCGYISLWE